MRTGLRNLLTLATGLAAVTATTLGLRAALARVPLHEAVDFPPGLARPDHAPYTTERLPDTPWTLFLGGSSTLRGIDLAATGRPARKLAIMRGIPTDSLFALEWIATTVPAERWPERVVWGVNLCSFVPRPEYGPPRLTPVATGRPSPDLRARLGLDAPYLADPIVHPELDDERVREWRYHRFDPWFGPRETIVDALLVGLRATLLGGDGLLDPAPDVPAHPGFNATVTERGLTAWERLGAFGPEPLDPAAGAAIDAVIDVVGRLGAELVVVSMPELSAARERYRPAAREDFRRLFTERDLPWLDLFDAIPDAAMNDHGHVNDVGRRELTRRVTAWLDARDER